MDLATQTKLLELANEVAKEAVKDGHHPFGAILVAPDAESILMRQGNVDTVRHAETELARRAAQEYDRDYLWKCSLVTTLEPCAMCSGTIYWSNSGTVIYGAPETDLKELTGSDPENPTMDLPCRVVFDSGQKDIKVYGPIPSLKESLLAPHKEFWNKG
jgi:tRNA(Arg) A34 adenosine deaminase TadA